MNFASILTSLENYRFIAWLILPLLTAFLTAFGYRFKNRMESKKAHREDIKLIIDAATADKFHPEGLRELCLEKSVQNYFDVDIPYRALLKILEGENSDLVFEEYNKHKRVLYYDTKQEIFYKKPPIFTSRVLLPLILPIFQIHAKYQYYVLGLFSLVFVILCAFGLSSALDHYSAREFFSASINIIISFSLFVYAFLIASTIWSSSLAYKSLEFTVFLPYENKFTKEFVPKYLFV